jgi:predicted DNA-binding transcriptional regulator AlpA
MSNSNGNSRAQVALAANAAALKAETARPALSAALVAAKKANTAQSTPAADDAAHQQHDQQNVHGAHAPPLRLLGKRKVLAIVGVSYVTIWSWMRAGTFPRSRVVGGKSMWRSDEIEAWLGEVPVRRVKGDKVTANPAGEVA